MKLIIFSNVSHRRTTKYLIVTLGKDNEQTNHTVKQWINHMKYKNMKYWDNNIALVQV
jgi:hypothetical protein